MNSTQRSSRYSSAGNSGYEDDFEVEDGELDIDAGQADYDDSPGRDETDGEDSTPRGGLAAVTSSYGGRDANTDERFGTPQAADDSQGSANRDLDPARTLFLGTEPYSGSASQGAAQTPVANEPSTASFSAAPASRPQGQFLPDDPVTGSPASPSARLPPLTAAVSPYLARGPGPGPSAKDSPDAQPPPSRLPAPPATPTGSISVTGPVLSAPGTASRPSISRGGPPAPNAHPSAPSTSRQAHNTPAPSQHPSHPHNFRPQQPQWQPAEPAPAASSVGMDHANASAMPALALALLQQASSSEAQQQHRELAAAISHSVEVLRASEQVRQLQAAVEALTGQLVGAERARAAAEGALVELTQRMQEQERRLNEAWEAKLLEKQREVQQMRTKVQQLEAQGIKGRLTAASAANPRGSQQGGVGPAGAGGAGSSSSGGAAASISPEEAAALRKELQQTEVLIRGYQQENEAATRRIKDLEESLAAAESRAAEEVLRSERAVLLARDDAGRRNAEAASKLTRVLALERELEGVREEARTREAELRSQLDKLRAEKRELEGRAGGVDLKAMAEGDVLVKQLREEMEASRQATQTLIQDMQAKLSWYAENQELLNRNDALLAEQRDTIQQLQARLAEYERTGGGGGTTTAKGGPAATRQAAAQARIRELEAQVDQLHKALRSRAPANSLAAVVAAARPSPEESQLVEQLRGRVEQLEGELRGKDEEFEVQLRSYQQQFERLKAQYSERAGRLEAVTKVRTRVKDLERQLEEQKGIFGRRVRELEAKLKAAQEHGAAIPPTPAPGAPPLSAAGGPASAFQTPTKGQQAGPGVQAPGSAAPTASRRDDLVPAAHLRARELEVKKLQTELDRKSKQVSELHLKLGEAESRIVRLTADLRRAHANGGGVGLSPLPGRSRHDGVSHDERPVGPSRGARQQLDPYPSADHPQGGPDASSRALSADLVERLEERCGNLTVENGNLRGQVADLNRQLAALRRELEEARAAAAQPAAVSDAALASATSDLRRQLEAAQLALVTVQRSAAEAVERGALAGAEHQRTLLRLHDEVAYKEGLKWQERLATLEQELRTAQQRCEQLEGELAVARSRGAGAWSPEAAAFAAMERRLDDMARDMAAREAKWRAVLQDTQSLHSVQSNLQRQKWESTLAAKEAEVQATRSELQALMAEVTQVQELQARLLSKQQQLKQSAT